MPAKLPVPLANAYRRLYYAANSVLQTHAWGPLAGLCRPGHIAFLLTYRCSAKCVHCDIWRNRGVEHGPTEADWRRAVAEIRAWLGPVHIVFTGGEALLKPFTVDLVAYASSLGLQVELLSHGYWKDRKLFERLAAARPWRVTFSIDAVGPTHDLIRGRAGFFERASASIEALEAARSQLGLQFPIRLKTVVMEHNLDDLEGVARYATRTGMDVLYQAIEPNYGSPEIQDWRERGANWPRDATRAIAALDRLIALRREGLHIANKESDLRAMQHYFRDPETRQTEVVRHSHQNICAFLSNLEVHADGDVHCCFKQPAIGNIQKAPLREIWAGRPHYWSSGCCWQSPDASATAKQ